MSTSSLITLSPKSYEATTSMSAMEFIMLMILYILAGQDRSGILDTRRQPQRSTFKSKPKDLYSFA